MTFFINNNKHHYIAETKANALYQSFYQSITGIDFV